jgi:hypothetical protein
MRLILVVIVVLAGCTCQLSGTPLDTMEKKLNPACWSFGDDDAPPPAAPNSDPS